MFPKKFLNQNIRIIKGKIYTASNYRDSVYGENSTANMCPSGERSDI